MKTELSPDAIGRSGEFLAASILERHGIQATRVNRWDTDLWVETQTGRILRAQVKTCSAPALVKMNGQGVYDEAYRFSGARRTQGRASDVFIFVALDRQLLLVRQPPKGTLRIPFHRFTPEAQAASIAELLY